MRFAVRHVTAALLVLGLGGCASTGNQSWWPDGGHWRSAVRHATRSPGTWAPAAAAVAFAAGDWDADVSDWARRETPLFGSTEQAHHASDNLLAATQVSLVVSALALPGEDRPAGSRVGRLILEESAALTTAGLVEALKHASGRTRPNGESDLSFPSGHAAIASSFATMTLANLRQSGLSPAARRILATGVGALAVSTSWARIEAGEHYPSDVLAGAALGHFVSVVIHDAWLGSSEPPIVELELGPSRQAIAVRMGF